MARGAVGAGRRSDCAGRCGTGPCARWGIAEIRSRERGGLVELPSRFKRGDAVRILRGPFREQIALYAGMKARERVDVLLSLLGGQHRVTLPRGDVEAV